MNWTQEEPHLWIAPGGYSVERRIGHWMTFVPGEDQAVYVSPPGLDCSKEAKRFAEAWAKQRRGEVLS
jgi:hypothetical protein